MDGKLYLFGIGGTGSRVIKSLVMLAASGVKFEASAIVPIIIDPDFANADLTRTIELLKSYSMVRKSLSFSAETKNTFFEVPIENTITNDFRLAIKDTKNKKFEDFIQYSTLSKENKALVSMLFSEKNMKADMEVGFKGNPNVGSVVLNQFTDSEDFANFASTFKSGDRVFIISSIFGGTGASGFPLLLKNLRSLDSNNSNVDAIKKAPIGAITVLPYFDVKPVEEGEINSSTFIGKTKAALHYYEKNVDGDNSSVNVLYYIGDVQTKQYEYAEGGNTQINEAHIIEFASALAVSDFISISKDAPEMQCQIDATGRIFVPQPVHKEFGIEETTKELISFNGLSSSTKEIVTAPMTRFALFTKYMRERIKSSLNYTWAKDMKIDDAFMKSDFVSELLKVMNAYYNWIREMEKNKLGFKPFEMSVPDKKLFSIVYGVKPSKIKNLKAFLKEGYDLFDSFLNSEYQNISQNFSKEQRFADLFYSVTNNLVNNKYQF